MRTLIITVWCNLNSKVDFKSREQSEQLIVSLGGEFQKQTKLF